MIPAKIYELIDEHNRCQNLMYYIQRHHLGKPIDEKTRDLIKRQQQMDRVLKTLKSTNRI